ncbi:hypothetical protein ASZ90_007052 [hydrocarbon metagenome]|uniref:Uncharacterized protein n=1 Tax=hydrocarbon metagenome TaxID=938273 RepID=A0A0W8FQC0_9ZZZZ
MQSSGDVCKNQLSDKMASICSSGAGEGILMGVSISRKLFWIKKLRML